ncbi:unnamed protein product, partial [Effrenium voratum]
GLPAGARPGFVGCREGALSGRGLSAHGEGSAAVAVRGFGPVEEPGGHRKALHQVLHHRGPDGGRDG